MAAFQPMDVSVSGDSGSWVGTASARLDQLLLLARRGSARRSAHLARVERRGRSTRRPCARRVGHALRRRFIHHRTPPPRERRLVPHRRRRPIVVQRDAVGDASRLCGYRSRTSRCCRSARRIQARLQWQAATCSSTAADVGFPARSGDYGRASTIPQAQADMRAISDGLQQSDPGRERRFITVEEATRAALPPMAARDIRRFVALLMSGVAATLLIACANVAGLLLARGAARRPELELRRALGAGRARLVRQLLTEYLLLAMAGTIAGIFVAKWAMALLAAYNLPGAVPCGLTRSESQRARADVRGACCSPSRERSVCFPRSEQSAGWQPRRGAGRPAKAPEACAGKARCSARRWRSPSCC